MQVLTLQEWLRDNAEKPLDRELLQSITEKFSHSRRNFTVTGKMDLKGANFVGQDVSGLSLSIYDISGINFKGAKVDRKQFSYIMKSARQGKVKLDGIVLAGVDLSGMNLQGLDLNAVSFKDVKLDRSALFSMIDVLQSGKADLSGCNLSGAQLNGDVLNEPNIGINGFQYFDLSDIKFDGANFEGANLSGAILDRTSLAKANLTKVTMIASFARDANFQGAVMREAKLCNSDFSYSNFDEADLTNAEV